MSTKDAPKTGFKDKLNEYKGEFKRIIWPNKKELKDSTVSVIITCILFGILIFIMDFLLNSGIEIFVNMVS